METKNNPIPRMGKRNIYCPYYSGCLDVVIRKNWAYWNCTKCEERANREAEPEIALNVNYTIAYYELSTRA